MSMIQRIKGADFSASGLPKLRKEIRGLPAGDSLAALYLFEEAAPAVGQPFVGPALDVSGKGKHAAFRSSSVAVTKTATGIASAGGNVGFAFDTGVPYGPASFTVLGCYKMGATADATIRYAIPWLSSSASAWPSLGGGAVYMNQVFQTGTEAARANIAVASRTGLSGSVSDQRVSHTVTGPTTNNAWVAWALTWDTTADQLKIHSAGKHTADTDSATWQDIKDKVRSAQIGNHAFGLGSFSNTVAGGGDVGLFGVWNEAFGDTSIDEMLVAAKAIMTARGATIF